MKGLSCMLLLCVVVVVSFAQPKPPVISETFSTNFRTEMKTPSKRESIYHVGEAHVDYVEKKSMSFVTTTEEGKEKTHDWTLELYKMNESYSYHWEGEDPTPSGECRKHPLTNSMEPFWAWTRNTTYNDTITYENHRIDVFVGMDGDTEISIGVAKDDPNVPYFTSQHLKEFFVIYYYNHFTPNIADQSVFKIPENCHGPP